MGAILWTVSFGYLPMPSGKSDSPFSSYRAMGLVLQVGLLVSGGAVLGAMAGIWVEKRLEQQGWPVAVGVFVGLAVGLMLAVLRLLQEVRWKP